MTLASLLNQVGTIGTQSGKDRYGNPEYGDAVEALCRVEVTNKTILNKQGELEPIDAIIFFPHDAVVSRGDQFNYSNTAYRIMGISPIVDGRGVVRHYEAKAQLWAA